MRLLIAVLALTAGALGAQGPAARRAVTIPFQAVVGDSPFACGTKYPGLGRTAAETWATEFRFFVHDVALLTRDGTRVPVELTPDGIWQDGTVALLDFEDGSGPCANGTPERRSVLTGTVPEGDYVGLEFRLGVPAERNHLEAAAQPSPLNLTRLYWSWTTGYKYLRIDLRAQHPDRDATQPWMIHLGATGCTPADSASAAAGPPACRQANRPEIQLSAFDLASDVVILDLAALVAGADLLQNQPKSAAGCMSGPEDADCAPIFAALGLTHPLQDQRAIAPAFRRAPAGVP